MSNDKTYIFEIIFTYDKLNNGSTYTGIAIFTGSCFSTDFDLNLYIHSRVKAFVLELSVMGFRLKYINSK